MKKPEGTGGRAAGETTPNRTAFIIPSSVRVLPLFSETPSSCRSCANERCSLSLFTGIKQGTEANSESPAARTACHTRAKASDGR